MALDAVLSGLDIRKLLKTFGAKRVEKRLTGKGKALTWRSSIDGKITPMGTAAKKHVFVPVRSKDTCRLGAKRRSSAMKFSVTWKSLVVIWEIVWTSETFFLYTKHKKATYSS